MSTNTALLMLDYQVALAQEGELCLAPPLAAQVRERDVLSTAKRVLEAARADGYRAMVFNAVVETNTPAVGLWRSLGFDVVATIPEGFNHPVKGYVGLHVMHRQL